ncbi:MAG: T9SS type A sorting domain-containing protein [Reichenbachiella sp.]|uniref:T9SS type A sorting domain-containing protein n=1 Tax=Reichenbachiella sp. TaxID=2184521 RepID=UPI003298F1A5
MRKINLLSIALVMMFLGSHLVSGQQAFLSASGEASTSSGSVSYGIGQLITTSSNGPGGSAGAGVLQSYDVEVILGAAQENIQLDIQLSTFPNPVIDFLTVQMQGKEERLDVNLFDMNGTLLKSTSLENNQATIPMRDLAEAIYILEVSRRMKRLKSFRIIKR